MLKLKEIMEALNRFAPWDLAEDWDRVGLQVGQTEQTVRRIMVALDMNERVLEEGLNLRVDGFLIHHPFLFKPLTKINTATENGRILARLLKEDLFLIAAHTNMDKAVDGLNQVLAELFGLQQIETLDPVPVLLHKVVVFVPESQAVRLRQLMSAAGAGQIADYYECAFQSPGTGSFIPGMATHPYHGELGVLAEVGEIRLEMQVEGPVLDRVLQTIHQNHPYEEPVVDVYPLKTKKRFEQGPGLGRFGHLPEKTTLAQFSQIVKKALSLRDIRLLGSPGATIERIALCSGSGGDLLPRVFEKGADVYLTGELHYHDYLSAAGEGIAVIEAGHWGTEHLFGAMVARFLEETYSNTVLEVINSQAVTAEPFITF